MFNKEFYYTNNKNNICNFKIYLCLTYTSPFSLAVTLLPRTSTIFLIWQKLNPLILTVTIIFSLASAANYKPQSSKITPHHIVKTL